MSLLLFLRKNLHLVCISIPSIFVASILLKTSVVERIDRTMTSTFLKFRNAAELDPDS